MYKDLRKLIDDIEDPGVRKAIDELWRQTSASTSIIDNNVAAITGAVEDLRRQVTALSQEVSRTKRSSTR